ncbi:MAG: hypothetical protein ACP5NL_04815 [Thermoplasmata archaeon]
MNRDIEAWMKSHRLADLESYLEDDYFFDRALEIIDLVNDLTVISENYLDKNNEEYASVNE